MYLTSSTGSQGGAHDTHITVGGEPSLVSESKDEGAPTPSQQHLHSQHSVLVFTVENLDLFFCTRPFTVDCIPSSSRAIWSSMLSSTSPLPSACSASPAP